MNLWRKEIFLPFLRTKTRFFGFLSSCTRWFKYDRNKLWLVYTQIVPVIFEPPCTCTLIHEYTAHMPNVLSRFVLQYTGHTGYFFPLLSRIPATQHSSCCSTVLPHTYLYISQQLLFHFPFQVTICSWVSDVHLCSATSSTVDCSLIVAAYSTRLYEIWSVLVER
jgi:hypothetical protein